MEADCTFLRYISPEKRSAQFWYIFSKPEPLEHQATVHSNEFSVYSSEEKVGEVKQKTFGSVEFCFSLSETDIYMQRRRKKYAIHFFKCPPSAFFALEMTHNLGRVNMNNCGDI